MRGENPAGFWGAASARSRAGAEILLAGALIAAGLASASCVAEPARGLLPDADYRPPALLEAGPTGARLFLLRFDEPVSPVEGSIAFGAVSGAEAVAATPAEAGATGSRGLSAPAVETEGPELRLVFAEDQVPGADYLVSGEAVDDRGNSTRFALRFVGWNARPPRLALSEVQSARNSSTTRPHRDYVELEALGPGNLGGVELSWASSVKTFKYRFPAAEVAAGDFIVLHLAPEGKAEELDEEGSDLGLSGGVDSRPYARDFWSGAGGIPDENGAMALAERPGGPVVDALFYAADDKTGTLSAGKFADFVAGFAAGSGGQGAWTFAGPAAAWEDAFRRKPSAARSMLRIKGGPVGADGWESSLSGGQSPGAAND